MARLMRAMPELLTLIKGITAATRSVSCTLALLIMFLYIFSIVFTQQLCNSSTPNLRDAYGSLGMSMFTLFMAGTLLDNVVDYMTDLKDAEEKGDTYMLYVFGLFILLSSFTVLNMLIGVLCEVVTETSAHEAENAMVIEIKEEITGVFQEIDVNGDGTVSKDEFDQMKESEIVRAALNKVGVKPKHFFALSDVLFEPPDLPPGGEKDEDQQEELASLTPEERQAVLARRASVATGTQTKTTTAGTESVELEFNDFLEMVISQRPEKYASVMDTALLRQMFRTMIHRVDVRIERYMVKLEKLQEMSGVMTRKPEDEVNQDEAITQAERLLEYYGMHHHRSTATIRESRKLKGTHFGNHDFGMPSDMPPMTSS